MFVVTVVALVPFRTRAANGRYAQQYYCQEFSLHGDFNLSVFRCLKLLSLSYAEAPLLTSVTLHTVYLERSCI